MKKVGKVALLAVSAAMAVSVCSVFAGCGKTDISVNDFVNAMQGHYYTALTAEKVKMNITENIAVKAPATSAYGEIEVNLSGNDNLKKLKSSMLDYKSEVTAQTKGKITDDISHTFSMDTFASVAQIKEGETDSVNTISSYVRDGIGYNFVDGEITNLTVGERNQGDTIKSMMSYFGDNSYGLTSAVRVAQNKQIHPNEKSAYSLGGTTCEVTKIDFKATRSDDKLQATANIELSHKITQESNSTSDMTNTQKEEYFGHLVNRNFDATVSISLTIDNGASLSKGKFDDVDVSGMGKDMLYLDYGNIEAVKESLHKGEKVEINLLGDGAKTTAVGNVPTYSVVVLSNVYIEEQKAASGSEQQLNLQADTHYTYDDKGLVINKDALKNLKDDYIENLKSWQPTGSSVNYTANVHSVQITFYFRALRKDAVANTDGTYDSDQYRSFSQRMTIYY